MFRRRELMFGKLTCHKVVVWRFGILILMKIVFLWTCNALFLAAILSLISSSIQLSVFTIVPEYFNEFTCSDFSSPVFMWVGWIVFLVQFRYLVLLLFTITPAMGLLLNPITYRCLLKMLCPVRRPITTLDCVLLKDTNRALVARTGPEINLRACPCVLQALRHITKHPAFYLSSKVLPRDPKFGKVLK